MEVKKKITIQDIAERANVSISTVSRVLNATGPVAEEKRQAVLKAAADLQLRPNLLAQSLKRGHNMTIGILTQLISSPFFDTIMRGIVDQIDGTNFLPIFADGYWNAQRERQSIDALLSRRVGGLIVIAGCVEEEYLLQVAAQVPLIVVARSLPSLADQCISLDNNTAAQLAVRHLIEHGHQRIAHITGLETHQDAVDRKAGYLQALDAAGITPDPDLLIEGDFTEASGVLGVEMLLTRGRMFSAIFTANDQMAFGARLAFYRRGIRVPEEVSLVGFDDQAPAAHSTPPLTTVRWPALEIGKAAAQGLLHLMQGKPCALPQFPPRLVVRESVSRRFG